MDPEAEAGQQHKRMRTSAANNIEQPPHAEEQPLAESPNPASPFTTPIPPSSAPAASDLETASTWQASDTGDLSTAGGQGSGRTRSSARKRLRSLALQEDGIVTRSLKSGTDMPLELRKLLQGIEDCGNGFGVISNQRRQEIEDLTKLQGTAEVTRPRSTYRVLNHAMWYPAGDSQQQRREALGPTPHTHDVLAVLEWADRCSSQAAEEAMWNAIVHVPLLQLAVYGGRRIPEKDDKSAVTVELTQCTTARIIREYLPAQETSGKQIDFCFHLNVDSTAQQAIDRVRSSLPLLSINHFDMDGLIDQPIAVSCESKKLDSPGGATEAKLQIGMWHAAQWKLLKELITCKSQQHAQQPVLPAFLPAVIIAGHDWSFAATTQEQDKTVGGPPSRCEF